MILSSPMSTIFASDNTSGAHPKVLESFTNCNDSYEGSYGGDQYTQRARDLIKIAFGDDAEAHFLVTGSAANVLGLSTVTKSYNSIITSDQSHLDNGTCGGAEKFIGCKLVLLSSIDGKISPKQIDDYVAITKDDVHVHIPSVISITQPTELGTCYTLEEMSDLSKCAKRNGLYLQVDGARFANAAEKLGVTLKELTRGVDILSFGGTKNGILFGDCLIFFNSTISKNFKYVQKQAMHLMSKMRYVSCQFIEYLNDELWRSNAKNANQMMDYFVSQLSQHTTVKISYKTETNILFLELSETQEKSLSKKYWFKTFNGNHARFVTSWRTSQQEIDEFVLTLNL